MKPETLDSIALPYAADLLSEWIPDGRQDGDEFIAGTNPNRADDTHAGSYRFNVETGAWADFAIKGTDSRAKGYGLTSFLVYHFGLSRAEAEVRLRAGVAEWGGEAPAKTRRTRTPVPPAAPMPWQEAPPFNLSIAYLTRGKANAQIAGLYFLDRADGMRVGGECRIEYDDEDGKRDKLPLRFSLRLGSDGKPAWTWKQPDKPFPLYGLGAVAANPEAKVLVVEGPKKADAVRELLPPGWVSVSFLGGAQSVKDSDWTSLAGRSVLVWPDADAAGRDAATTIASTLQPIAASVVTLNPDAAAVACGLHAAPPAWDAADAVKAGMSAETLARILEDRTTLRLAAGSPPSGFDLGTDGIWFTSPDPEEKGRRQPVASRLEVVALTRDQRSESWGRLLRWTDQDGVEHTWPMPMDHLAEDAATVKSVLVRGGVIVDNMSLLSRYISRCETRARVLCVDTAGWHGDAYILGSGVHSEAIGGTEPVVVQGGALPYCDATAGTVDEWRNTVAKLCEGNSRLMFAVCCAFAGPLLEPMGVESGGFNLRGPTSKGKSMAQRAAASVFGAWGRRPGDLHTWRTTDNALEGLAARHNDGCLILDELAQIDPAAAGAAAYMLANGTGKLRIKADTTARPTKAWRVLVLSSGEIGLAEHVESAGKRAMAGHGSRFPDIPAEAGADLGCFENIHSSESGAAFAERIREVSAKCYGVAGPAFLRWLVKDRRRMVGLGEIWATAWTMKHVPKDSDGQVSRVAKRFALVAAAGELATRAGITGWVEGMAAHAAARCFKAWLGEREGGETVSAEMSKAIGQIRRLLEQHGGSRFQRIQPAWSPPGSTGEPTFERDGMTFSPHNRLGYLRERDGKHLWLIMPKTWKDEFCRGFDAQAVARELARRGHLIPGENGRLARTEHVPGLGKPRVYVLDPSILSGGEEEEARFGTRGTRGEG